MARLLFLILFLGTNFSLLNAGTVDKPKVLYLGDSLSMGAFGESLDSGLRKNGAEVVTVVAGGSSPYYWLKAYQTLPSTIGYWEKTPAKERKTGYIRAVPKMEDLIEQHQPGFVVIQTGVNLYATLRSRRRPKADNVAEVRSLIEQMSHSVAKAGAKAYWILPPQSHERRYSPKLQFELASIMMDTIREYGGAVFRSDQVTKYKDPYPATDGIHYNSKDSKIWANKVSADLSIYIQESKGGGAKPKVLVASVDKPIIDQSTEYRSPKELGEASKVPNVAPPEPIRKRESLGQPKAVGKAKLLDLDLRLVAKSNIDNQSEIKSDNALGVFEYEVINDRLGNYSSKRVRVAHGIVFRRKFTKTSKREIGSTVSLRLVPLDSYQALKYWQTENDLPANSDLVIYTPKLD